MKKELFSPMEIDAIGEMMNISLGSSATAVSNLLDQRVDITTPEVTVVEVEDFSIGNLEPAMGVEIKYVEGLEGSNIMLLRRSDIKVIVDILMGGETPEEEFELNDLTISAVCEVMNQMMGAASTAMSDFLGFPVNISTPLPFELKSLQEFKENHLPQGAKTIVVVRFSLKIEKALESEFMNVMSVSLAKELLAGLGLEEEDDCPAPAEPSMASGGGKQLSQEEIEKLLAAERSGKEAPSAQEMPSGSSGGKQLSQEEIEKMMAGSWGEAPAAPFRLSMADLFEKGLVTSSITLWIAYDHRYEHEASKGTVKLERGSNSSKKIIDAVADLYLRIADKYTGIRRIEVCANRVAPESYVQYSLFDDPKQTDKERHLQEAVLNVKQRYGKNAIMRGSNLLECSTYRERNEQIGGHRA